MANGFSQNYFDSYLIQRIFADHKANTQKDKDFQFKIIRSSLIILQNQDIEQSGGRQQIVVSHNKMGNSQQNANINQNTIEGHKNSNQPNILPHKYFLQLLTIPIVLSHTHKAKVSISHLQSFPSGFQGLHLWDSNIVLARWVYSNPLIFQNKSVIQLLSGTGIGSICVKKWTKATKIAATDRKEQIIMNIGKNCKNNGIQNGMMIARIQWTQYRLYKAKFDLVIGADLLFKGSPVNLLLDALSKLLNIGGLCYIIVPWRNGEDQAKKFQQLLSAEKNSQNDKLKYSQIFKLKKQKLVDQIYMQSPLLNQVQGLEQYKLIAEGLFYLYSLQKIKDKIQDYDQKSTFQNPQSPLAKKNPIFQNSAQSIPKIKIKQQILNPQNQKQVQEQLAKQLQIITVNKKQDKPEYERKKRKTIGEIIAQSEQNKQDVGEKTEQMGTRKREFSKNSTNKSVEQQNQIQVVKKQHQLYNQPPPKKSDTDKRSDRNSIGSSKDRQQAVAEKLEKQLKNTVPKIEQSTIRQRNNTN